MLTRLGRLVVARPRRVLLATLVFLVLAGVLGGPVAGLLSTGDDFADPGSEAVAAKERIEAATGVGATASVVVLVRPADGAVTTPAGRAAIRSVQERLAAIDGVARTVSLLDTSSQAFVSRDGSASYVVGFVRAQRDEQKIGEAATETFADDRTVTVGGVGPAQTATSEQVAEDLARAELLAFPILFLLSLWVFRGVVAALLPLFVGLLTIMGTFLGLRIANEATLLSIFALNLAIGLGLGLAIDYSLFIVTRFREELAARGNPRAAMAATYETAGRTVVFSALTVAAALLALLVFPQRFLYSMAIAGALCALVAAAVSLTALPALLVLLGRRVDALAPFGPWRPTPEGGSRGFWYRLSRLVMRRPVLFAVTTSAVLVLAGLPFARVAFTGVDARVLPADAGPRIVADAIDSEFPPGPTEPLLVAVDAPSDAAGAVATYADGLRDFDGVAAVGEPRPLDGATWLVEVVPSAPALDERTLTLVEDVRAAQAPGAVSVGGTPAGFVDQQAGMADRLPLALAILALTTVVLLFAMTGSVILPLKALVMNALTLSAAFGVLVLVFQDGRLEGLLDYTSQGALNSTQPLVLLCLAYGLSTDYAVFLLHRIKEERDAGASNEEAVALGLERTGRVVTAAALLFCVAIGAFATSEIVFIKQLGLGTAVAVVIDATIVRALLVPSLMRLLGEWNWWAPRPLQRLRVSAPSAASSGT